MPEEISSARSSHRVIFRTTKRSQSTMQRFRPTADALLTNAKPAKSWTRFGFLQPAAAGRHPFQHREAFPTAYPGRRMVVNSRSQADPMDGNSPFCRLEAIVGRTSLAQLAALLQPGLQTGTGSLAAFEASRQSF